MEQQKNGKRRHSRWGALDFRLLAMSLLVVLGVVLIVQLPGRSVAMAERSKDDVDFREFSDLFAEVYSRVKEHYVEPVDNKKLFEGAINGMMGTLDPYSSWLPPVQQDMLNKDTEGEYSGVGLHITLDDHKILTVLLPINGSPAAAAGVQPWDRIVQIDGQSTEGISMMDAVDRLTGPEGSEVKMRLFRPSTNKLFDVTVKRRQIKVESVFHKIFPGGIGYVRIVKFSDDTADGVQAALEDFNKNNVVGVIADVRYNAGGLLERAQEICDMFLPKDETIVSIKGRTSKDNRVYYSLHAPICKQPMIVLVNQYSASASEIFAGAMQDNHRAVVMGPKGERTYGKASVQTISPLKYSLDQDQYGNYLPSGLRLTTAHYYTPSGALIMDKGIKPDIGIELTAAQEQALREHGLLGDPSRIEPADETTTGTQKQVAPVEKDDTSTSTQHMVEMLESGGGAAATAEAEPKGEFHDVLLDEGLKYLQAILIFDKSNRKAA